MVSNGLSTKVFAVRYHGKESVSEMSMEVLKIKNKIKKKHFSGFMMAAESLSFSHRSNFGFYRFFITAFTNSEMILVGSLLSCKGLCSLTFLPSVKNVKC